MNILGMTNPDPGFETLTLEYVILTLLQQKNYEK